MIDVMRGNRRRGTPWLALAAAIALLVRSLGVAYAADGGVSPALLDGFGNPLCIASSNHAAPNGAPHPGNAAGCCTLACQILAHGWMAAPPDAPALWHPSLGGEAAPQAGRPDAHRAWSVEIAADPRGPPAA